MLYSRIKCILGLIIIVFIVVLTESYIAIMILGVYLLSIMMSIIFVHFIKKKLYFDINIPNSMNKHQVKKIMVKVKNTSVLPLSKGEMTLTFYNATTGEKRKTSAMFSVSGKHNTDVLLEVKSDYCGSVEVIVQCIRLYDLFNIVSEKILYSCNKKIVVFPEIIDFSTEVMHGVSIDYESNEYIENKNGNDTDELFGYRDYYPGDSLHRINWKLTGKWNSLIVKENSIPVDHSIMILADTTRDKNIKSEESAPLYDCQMEVISSLSESLLHSGYKHDVKWFDYKKDDWINQKVCDEDEIALMVQSLLNASRQDDDMCSIERYILDEHTEHYSHIVYVSTRLNNDKNIENILSGRVLSIIAATSKEMRYDSGIIVTTDNWKQELAYLSI